MEIMCDILEAISSGNERPTHILYKANISWKVLNNCMKTLLSQQLVTKEDDGKRDIYRLTDRGYAVLHLYRDLKTKLPGTEKIIPVEFARGF